MAMGAVLLFASMAVTLRTQLDTLPAASTQQQQEQEQEQQQHQAERRQLQQQQQPLRAAPRPAAMSEREREAERVLLDMQHHVQRHGPAHSFFPAGCRWREVGPRPASSACDPRNVKQRGTLFGGLESVWSCHGVEYLSSDGQEWVREQPAECRLQAVPLATWAGDRAALRLGNSSVSWGSSSTMSTWGLEQWLSQQRQTVASDVRCAGSYCLFRNLWYGGGQFYFLQDPHSPTQLPPRLWQVGRNRRSSVLSVRSAADFAASLPAARVATGETVALDYTFFLHPKALGHWLEQLLPLFR